MLPGLLDEDVGQKRELSQQRGDVVAVGFLLKAKSCLLHYSRDSYEFAT
jgi:hypothetical protein